jgi:hypothetical protein
VKILVEIEQYKLHYSCFLQLIIDIVLNIKQAINFDVILQQYLTETISINLINFTQTRVSEIIDCKVEIISN